MADAIDDKTVLVTGANSGIGKATVRGLAERGAEVLMLCRSEERGQAALDEVRADTGSDALELVLCDLGSFEQIRETAARLREDRDTLDVLVNNAGLVLDDRYESEDGFEQQFAVNHLAPFLLTHELLPLLQAAGETSDDEARVVNVSSEAHRNVSGVPEGFEHPGGSYNGFAVYSKTKLYNILFTRELARRLDPQTLTANCLHPGVIGSNFGSGGPWYVRWFMKVARPFLTSPKQGAQTSLYLATSSDVDGYTGGYFADEAPVKPTRLARDDDLARELWATSEELTGADDWPEPREPVEAESH